MKMFTEVTWFKLLLPILYYILPQAVGKYTKDPITINADFCRRSTYWTYDIYSGESNTASWDGSELSDGCKIEFEPESLDIFNRYTVCLKTKSFSLSCSYVVKIGIDKTTTMEDESESDSKLYPCGITPPEICTTDTYQALVVRIERTSTHESGSYFTIEVNAFDHGDDSGSTSIILPVMLSVAGAILLCTCLICIAKRSQATRRNAQDNYTHVLQQGVRYVDRQSPQPNIQIPSAPPQNIQMNYVPNVQYNPEPPAKHMYSVDPPPYSSLQLTNQHSVPPKGPGSVTGQPLQLPVSQEECSYKVYDAV